MKLKSVRVTALSLYEKCPYCFYLAQTGVKQHPDKNLLFGTAVHNAIQFYHTNPRHRIAREAVSALHEYARLYTREFEMCEQNLKAPLFNTGIELTGTPDLVKGDWIYEHKTSSGNWTQDQVDRNRQATGYSWLYRAHTGREEQGIRFNIFVKNKTIVLRTLDTYRTQNDFGEWRDWVMDILDRIKTDKFDPRPGRQHLYSICPMSL